MIFVASFCEISCILGAVMPPSSIQPCCHYICTFYSHWTKDTSRLIVTFQTGMRPGSFKDTGRFFSFPNVVPTVMALYGSFINWFTLVATITLSRGCRRRGRALGRDRGCGISRNNWMLWIYHVQRLLTGILWVRGKVHAWIIFGQPISFPRSWFN